MRASQTLALAFLLSLLFSLTGCTGKRSSTAPRRKLAQAANPGGTATRRIYPYSLIPGGIESEAELRTYSAVDPVLADHYKTLSGGMALTTADRDQWLYASYRMVDAVYWTSKPILVHAGEAVLSNGKDLVRARCGNRLSAKPQVPVHRFEPPSVSTDRYIPQVVVLQPPAVIESYPPPTLPDFPKVRPPERTGVAPGIVVSGRTGVPPAIVTGGSRFPVGVNAPEPGTWLLLSAGLFGMAGWHVRRKRSLHLSTRRKPAPGVDGS